MSFKTKLEVTLIFFTGLIIAYNLVITAGTNCFDKFSMSLSLFALIYAIFLRII